jgi:hypothetical protein
VKVPVGNPRVHKPDGAEGVARKATEGLCSRRVASVLTVPVQTAFDATVGAERVTHSTFMLAVRRSGASRGGVRRVSRLETGIPLPPGRAAEGGDLRIRYITEADV